ncbi:MAG: ribose 5-phosphate isomerase B [Myxococcales bacterium]|nr:ribose 5-phosphate isomerase B [Myxococcales bacterium]
MTGKETWFFGSDHAGLDLKNALVARAKARGLEVVDLGTHDAASTDYPDYAHEVARRVAAGEGRGVLVCGTGIGMSIAANRHPGVRAALCAEPFGARMTRLHNDANVLCLGARITGPGLAEEIFDVFVDTPFEGGRHARRVTKIDER